MACNDYTPAFQKQLTSYSLGAASCTCYSGAMAGEYHTCGAQKPTGKRVRQLTGDTVGGTTLLQVDTALQKGWNINLDTRIGSTKLTWDQFVAKINSGKGAILQGSYSAIHDTKFSGDPNFTGNHAIYVPPEWKAMDPLADGRRAGIYKYHGEVYPQDMLRKFAGLLELDPKKHIRLGLGYVWCSLTRDNTTKFVATVPARNFYRYHVNSAGKIYKRTTHLTVGFSGECTPPNTFAVDKTSALYNQIKSKSLVLLLEGGHKGWYIASPWAKEV